MNFPLINISAEKWDSEDLIEYIIFDEFIYSDDESIFNKYYRNQHFIDCDGYIFIPLEKAELKEKWRSWLRFIPNIWKREIIFQPTGKSWTVEKLRNYLLSRVSELKKDKYTEKWIADLKTAKNHYELINGQE
ncbi:hypothetical protein LPB85_13585 [Chryseobacterium sp. LC2016-27]|jgi:hypothetical protein|uniref:hypothetical protein n=1 Tax=Chryseobacterium sp. LC2016-27 TaxID=2897326 RepID=UPI001E5ADD64|nr:hypothetical protein [Chryseobacterium sp. LC2016-27]MCD0456473.1 hypothetical protein [Chryseobacterium sp. LC2016-27]